MQPEILRRSGWGHCVTPRGSEPLHRAAIGRIERNPLQIIEGIVEAHRPEAMEKTARIIQHHPRLFSSSEQLRDELSLTLVAPVKTGALWLLPTPGLSIMYFRLLITAAVWRSLPPAGMSG